MKSDRMTSSGKYQSNRRKVSPLVTLYPTSQIPCGLPWEQTSISAVSNRKLFVIALPMCTTSLDKFAVFPTQNKFAEDVNQSVFTH
jgi:hypothetical protein